MQKENRRDKRQMALYKPRGAHGHCKHGRFDVLSPGTLQLGRTSDLRSRPRPTTYFEDDFEDDFSSGKGGDSESALRSGRPWTDAHALGRRRPILVSVIVDTVEVA